MPKDVMKEAVNTMGFFKTKFKNIHDINNHIIVSR